MKRQLPPLSAVRVFEAAGRHLNFSHAAEELHVTQGAVSRQIKVLEAYLGKPLFIRRSRSVAFTSYGQDVHASIVKGMDMMESAFRQSRHDRRERLRISVPQSLGNLWLLPRLSAFNERYPQLDVSVVTAMAPADFSRDDYDVAIRLGRLPGRRYARSQPRIPHLLTTDWEGICAVHLWDEVLTPVLNADLLSSGRSLNAVEDLLEYPLLHVTPRPDAWSDWFRSQGVAYRKGKSVTFGHFFMAMEAARRGVGVALAPTLFLDSVTDLHRPFAPVAKSAGAYYLLYRETRADERSIRIFQKWLREQWRTED